MAKQIEQWETTKEGTESGGDANNNMYQTTAEKSVSNDNYPNGYGMSRASALKPFESFAGAEAIEQKALKDREFARFSALQASGAMGMDVKISNAGLVLDIVDAGYGQGGAKPNVQNDALK